MLFKKNTNKDVNLSIAEFSSLYSSYFINIILYDDCFALYRNNKYITISYDNVPKKLSRDFNIRYLYIKTAEIKKHTKLIKSLITALYEIHICCFVDLNSIDFHNYGKVHSKKFFIKFKLNKNQHLHNILNLDKIKDCVLCFDYKLKANDDKSIIIDNLKNSDIILNFKIENLQYITINNCDISSFSINDSHICKLLIYNSNIHAQTNVVSCDLINIQKSYINFIILSHIPIISAYKSTFNILKCFNSNILILNSNGIVILELDRIHYIKFKNINDLQCSTVSDCKILKINPFNINNIIRFSIKSTYISNFKFHYLKDKAVSKPNVLYTAQELRKDECNEISKGKVMKLSLLFPKS